jgi:hypothetical protein
LSKRKIIEREGEREGGRQSAKGAETEADETEADE